ncbi:hypothetical protein Tco_0574856, partial [Tanacetum coccineum]
RVNTFVDYKTELVEGSKKRAKDSTKRAGTEVEQEVPKKQKVDDDKEREDNALSWLQKKMLQLMLYPLLPSLHPL